MAFALGLRWAFHTVTGVVDSRAAGRRPLSGNDRCATVIEQLSRREPGTFYRYAKSLPSRHRGAGPDLPTVAGLEDAGIISSKVSGFNRRYGLALLPSFTYELAAGPTKPPPRRKAD